MSGKGLSEMGVCYMWSIAANISSIVTCFLFVLYIIGHIWKAVVTLHTKYEKFEIHELTENEETEEHDNAILLDNVGEQFTISSSYGIRNIKMYEVLCEIKNDGEYKLLSKNLKAVYSNLNVNETLYIKCDLGEVMPRIQLEIERADYTKVTCFLGTSGKTGCIAAYDYSFKMTFKSFLYYLCI